MTKDIAKDWVQKCVDSNGSMIILPIEMTDEANEIDTMKSEVEKKASAFNESNLELENKAQNFWYKVRKELQKNNVEGALEKTLGWNEDAKKDGVKVINIVAQMPRGPQLQGMRM